jgi:2-polyprenyl-3-methyl-5-hydroxy-6-metoxy-1,4-benzoquinol methylase
LINLAGGRILDVGCGSGFFLRSIDAAAWDRFGVEIDARAAGSASLAVGKANIFTGTLLESHYPDAHFDVVTFWSALEHVNQPRSYLAEARRVVKPGGTLIVQLPNAASRQLRWFGGDWFALDAPRHRYHFGFETLKRVLEEAGFEVYRATFFSKAHNAHALRQSLKAKLWTDTASAPRRALLYL